MQLILTTLVDGTLETQNELSRSLLTTTMPIDGFLTLRDLILHHPPGYATDILRSMTFIKVPFVSPIRVRADEIKVRITFQLKALLKIFHKLYSQYISNHFLLLGMWVTLLYKPLE